MISSRWSDIDPAPAPATEATRELASMAHRRSPSLSSELLAEHVVAIATGADWPVLREAMSALLRRLDSAQREELRVAVRPDGGETLGRYAVRVRRGAVRPYRILLRSVAPIEGSCDCPDFLRSSLGLCKHLFCVLEDLSAKPRRWRSAVEASSAAAAHPGLYWTPWRPLGGSGDWLDRVTLRGKRPAALDRWFAAENGARPGRRLRSAHAGDPARRLNLVEALGAQLSPRGRRGAVRNGEPEIDPALCALLAEEKVRLSREHAGRADLRALAGQLRTLKRKLYPYQGQAVLRSLERGRLLLADDMGLGKTAQATAICHALHRAGRVKRGLLIVPASLKPQWLREWQGFTDTPARIVDGTPEMRAAIYRATRSGFLIANYEQLLRDFGPIEAWNPEIVVLDEAQRIKNWATKTALQVKRLKPPYRLVLTGTPLQNRLDELVSVAEWVDDHALEPKWRVVPWHTIYADGDRAAIGVRNLETIRTRLEPFFLRRTRAEVLDQLPSRTDTRVPVEMTPAQWEEHDAFARPILRLMKIAKQRPLSPKEHLRLMMLLTQQRIISNGLAQASFPETWPDIRDRSPAPKLLASLDSPKLGEFRELLARIIEQPGRKAVVFSQWRRMLQLAHWAVEDLLADGGARAVFFTGKEGTHRRTQNIVEFHDDPATRVLFATDAGGTGLNLQRAANCCINLELPWNPAVLEQRIGRIYRIGQEHPIDVYNLVTEGGIEGRIQSLVGDKRALFDGLFDGDGDSIEFEGGSGFVARLEVLLGGEGAEAGESAAGEFGVEDDAAAERRLDSCIASADEAGDRADIEEPEADPKRAGAAGADGPRAERAPRGTEEEVRELFTGIRVHRRSDGTVSIEASRESAATLTALLEGVAALLGSVAAAPEPKSTARDADGSIAERGSTASSR